MDEPEPTLADLNIEFIETFCRIPEGSQVGQPFALQPFQREFIHGTYAPGVRRSLLSIARKNGKSTLIAALLLAHICGPAAIPNSQIVSAALSQDQASLVYDLAVKMIMLDGDLSARTVVRKSPRMIIGATSGVTYRPLASKAKTAMGLSPALVIFDEIGQVRGESDEFVEALQTSQGAYQNPLFIALSTQSATDSDLFSLWLDDARRTPDPTIYCQWHSADEDCPVTDEEQWRKANPGLGTVRTVEDIRTKASLVDRGAESEASFRNLFLNQRIEMFDPYVQRSVWQECSAMPDTESPAMWWGGIDLSLTTDLTAYVRVGWTRPKDGSEPRLACVSRFFLPAEGLADKERADRQPYRKWARDGWLETIPGRTVEYRPIAQIILKDLREGRLDVLAYDRWRIDDLLAEMTDVGATHAERKKLHKFGQGYFSMSPALDKLDGLLLNAKLAHGNHPVMDMCASNAVVQSDPAGNRKLTKAVTSRRIDGMVALAMAVGISRETPVRGTPMYSDPAMKNEIMT